MKTKKIVFAIALIAGALTSSVALADRGHDRVNFGISIGVPIGGPWYYPPAYYPPAYYPPYYPAYQPVVVAPPAAPVYVEKGGEAAAPSGMSSNYWYYCTNPQGYFPYVKDCQTSWMTVLPQAPNQTAQPVQPGPR